MLSSHLLQRGSIVALIVAALCACSSPTTPGPQASARGILLISVDAIRPDLLSIYGGEVEAPSLARLASVGTVFDNAATVSPMARPAAATLMTGLAPDRTGIRNDTFDRLDADLPTLASSFTASGRATAGMVSTPFCSYSSGLDSDFELFDGPEEMGSGPRRYEPLGTPALQMAERFALWVESLGPEREFFAWVHLADLHGVATAFPRQEDIEPAYAGRLRSVDEAVGLMLDTLEAAGRLDGTAIVVVGTHGVLLGEDGASGAAYWLRDETLRVPLIVKGPGSSKAFAPGSTSGAPVWLPDVAVTLAGFGGVALNDGADGVDLARGTKALGDRSRRAWTWAPDDDIAWQTLTAVEDDSGWRSFGWKELRAGDAGGAGTQAFDLARARPATPRARELPEEMKSRIEAEGLVTQWIESLEPEMLSTERSQFLTRLQFGRQAVARNRMTPARRALNRLLEEQPDNLAALTYRAYMYNSARKADLAVEMANRLLDRHPTRSEALHWAGHAITLQGRVRQGELLMEAALAITGPDPDLLYDLACARALDGDTDRALALLEQAIDTGFRPFEHIERDPDLASVRHDPRYVDLLGRRGR